MISGMCIGTNEGRKNIRVHCVCRLGLLLRVCITSFPKISIRVVQVENNPPQWVSLSSSIQRNLRLASLIFRSEVDWKFLSATNKLMLRAIVNAPS
jgi:hypothetical protein